MKKIINLLTISLIFISSLIFNHCNKKQFQIKSFNLTESKKDIIIENENINLRLSKKPFKFIIKSVKGKTILQSTFSAILIGKYRIASINKFKVFKNKKIILRDNPLIPAPDESYIKGDGIQLICETFPPKYEINLYIFFKSDKSISFVILSKEKIGSKVYLNFASNTEEHFFGLGEDEAPELSQKYFKILTTIYDIYPCQSTFKPPFYISTNGYGLFIDSYYLGSFDFTKPNRVQISFPLRFSDNNYLFKFDLYFGNNPKEILSQYNKDMGLPDYLIPSWSYAPFQVALHKVVFPLVKGYRNYGIPLGVIWHDWDWAPDFSNPWNVSMLNFSSGLKKYGIQFGVWLYSEKLSKFQDKKAINNFINKAQKWIKDNQIKIIEWDFGQAIGSQESEIRRLYTLFSSYAIFKALDNVWKGDFFIYSRGACHRGVKYISGKFGGDGKADFSEYGLAGFVTKGISASYSGLNIWINEVLPWDARDNLSCNEKIFMRWTEFSCFQPIMSIHREITPWCSSKRALNNYIKYANLHTRMFPYAFSYVYKFNKTGIPYLRGMYLEFPDDKNTYIQSNSDARNRQYMLGDFILVAPITSSKNSRKIYLPKGNWFYFWNDKLYQGNKLIEIKASLEEIPVFIREGAIIPFCPKMNYIG